MGLKMGPFNNQTGFSKMRIMIWDGDTTENATHSNINQILSPYFFFQTKS